MMRAHVPAAAIAIGVLVGACTRDLSPPPGIAMAPAPTSSPATLPAGEALDALDDRQPIPLLPMMANHQKQNMRDHLDAVQAIVAALAVEDYPAIETAAGRIGLSEEMGQMCNHMGMGAPAFTEQALGFHRTADRIAVAAKARDRGQVLTELGATLATCTACHATWKQQVVDEPTWRGLTSASAPHADHAP